jgi:hypothetical protein
MEDAQHAEQPSESVTLALEALTVARVQGLVASWLVSRRHARTGADIDADIRAAVRVPIVGVALEAGPVTAHVAARIGRRGIMRRRDRGISRPGG